MLSCLHAITILVQTLICAKVDYDNVVYIGLSSSKVSKLQSVHNAAARLIGGILKFSHISSFIRNLLHWLPIRHCIQFKIQFKICFLMRNCLIGSALQYLKDYCIPVSSIPSRSTFRSSSQGHFIVPRTWMSMTQSRSFAIVGPSNKLLEQVTSVPYRPFCLYHLICSAIYLFCYISSDMFCKHLKTSLFVTDLGQKLLWFKWCYLNVWLWLRISTF